MTIPTIKVYKGAKDVIINKSDVDEWRKNGWKTSSDRAKKTTGKPAEKKASEE